MISRLRDQSSEPGQSRPASGPLTVLQPLPVGVSHRVADRPEPQRCQPADAAAAEDSAGHRPVGASSRMLRHAPDPPRLRKRQLPPAGLGDRRRTRDRPPWRPARISTRNPPVGCRADDRLVPRLPSAPDSMGTTRRHPRSLPRPVVRAGRGVAELNRHAIDGERAWGFESHLPAGSSRTPYALDGRGQFWSRKSATVRPSSSNPRYRAGLAGRPARSAGRDRYSPSTSTG